MITKKNFLGKFSIELIEKGNNIHSLEITSGLNNAQIDVLTDILCEGHKGAHGEKFCDLVEDTIDVLSKILYSYDRKLKGERVIFKD